MMYVSWRCLVPLSTPPALWLLFPSCTSRSCIRGQMGSWYLLKFSEAVTTAIIYYDHSTIYTIESSVAWNRLLNWRDGLALARTYTGHWGVDPLLFLLRQTDHYYLNVYSVSKAILIYVGLSSLFSYCWICCCSVVQWFLFVVAYFMCRLNSQAWVRFCRFLTTLSSLTSWHRWFGDTDADDTKLGQAGRIRGRTGEVLLERPVTMEL